MFDILSGIFAILFLVPYIIGTVQRKIVPVIISWWIWFVNDTVIAISMYLADDLSPFMIASSFGTMVIACLSIRFGKIEWDALDKWCGGLCLLGIALGIIFNSPAVCLTLTVLVAVLSSMPTIRSFMQKPEDENKYVWLLYYIATWCAILGIQTWTFESAVAPMVFMLIGTYGQYLLWTQKKSAIAA